MQSTPRCVSGSAYLTGLTHPLDGARAKLQRCEDVIEQLNAAVVAYLNESPYEVIGEFQPERSEYVLRGRVTKAVPLAIGVIAGEVCHNMRSALDHLAWQLALLTTPAPSRSTQFPIALTEEEFRSKIGQMMIRDLSIAHRTAIEALQPYHGGDADALRDLRILSNTDKHRVINATIGRRVPYMEMQAELIMVRDVAVIRDVVLMSDGPVDNAELARMTVEVVGPEPKVKMEGQIPVTISFGDPALSANQPAVMSMLRAILIRIREIILRFEGDLVVP